MVEPTAAPVTRIKLWGRNSKPLALPAGFLLLALAFGLAGGNVAVAAQNVGVAAAVLPQVEATAPDEVARVLRIGVDIVADERVVTDANGKLQLLFLDGSALTVGPNSDVVVDKFVYDPEAEAGALTFSATKGVFRLVGWSAVKSQRRPVLLKTPHNRHSWWDCGAAEKCSG